MVAGRSAPWSTWMFFPPPPPPPLPPPLPPPPLPPPPPPAAATVRVPAALVRNSTTTGTCSSARFAPAAFMRVTVVVHPSLSATLFLTRSREWHEAQAVFTRFAATASGPLKAGGAPSGAWARITSATNTRHAATFKTTFRMQALYAIGRPRENGFDRLLLHFLETADAGIRAFTVVTLPLR